MAYTFPPLGCDQPPSCAAGVRAIIKATYDAASACSVICGVKFQINVLQVSISNLMSLINSQTSLISSLTSTAAYLMGRYRAFLAAAWFFAGLAAALAIACAASYGITCGEAVAASVTAAGLYYQATQIKSQLDQVNSQLSEATTKLNGLINQLNAWQTQLQALETTLQNGQNQLGAAQQAFQTASQNVLNDCPAACISSLFNLGLLNLPTCPSQLTA